MAEAHVKELLESNPNPTLEEEAAAMDIPAAETPVETTPAIPDKFMREGKPDYEALAKAYAELEKKQSGKKDDTNEEDTGNDEGEGEDASTDDKPDDTNSEDAAKDAAKSAGLDYDALSQEYWESGKLADSSYDALEKAGIPRHLVDDYIKGQEAILNSTRTSVYNEVGGESQYNAMVSWASENLTEAEIAVYDKTVNSGDMNQITLAVKGLQARFTAAEGFEPTVNIGGSNSKGADVFKSWAQVTKAMSDPRYGKDPAYVAEVTEKLERSGELL